ncbi:MAG: peptide ABC transporter substrate-binding protein [Oscillospiraceae bacterium]|nr:peptide ABC transporter substrate-binding protein [Oscillospiraceae bacterium]
MNKILHRALPLLLILVFIPLMLTGCEEDDGSGHTFKMNLASNPENLDPQLATDVSSRTVIANMMDGLVKKTPSGTIEPDVAEGYSISSDGTVYTFDLKNNITWEGMEGYKAKLTADDFVFAFQRIFDCNALYSPYVEDFSCIKNSSEVASGKLPPAKLGVRAEDEYTLVIELEYPYYNFLELLTTTAAMPCNRLFFESTKGKYGLTAEATISNGAFYLKEWNYDPYWDNNYIIMRRNKSNSGQDYVYPYSLNFFIKDEENNAEDYETGSIDCIITDEYSPKLLKDNNYTAHSVKSYGLVFNVSSGYFKNEKLRYALAASFNREMYSSALSENYTAAYGIIPDAVTVLGKSYRTLASDTGLSLYDKSKAAGAWIDTLKELELVSLDNVKITVPESFGGAEYLNYVTEQWQQNLGFFCGIEVVSQNEYDLKISENSFDIALVELSAENSVYEYFDLFTEGKNELQGYVDYAAKGSIYGVQRADTLSKAVELYTKAEKQVINSAVYIPLFYGKEYFVYTSNAQDLTYHPFSQEVDFRYSKYFD